MKKNHSGSFRRMDPSEILRKRVDLDRYVIAFSAILFVEFASSVIFPLADLYAYHSQGKTSSLRDAMHVSLTYALVCAVSIGAVTVLMAVFRLRVIERNAEIKGRKLYLTGMYGTGVIACLLLLFWVII